MCAVSYEVEHLIQTAILAKDTLLMRGLRSDEPTFANRDDSLPDFLKRLRIVGGATKAFR
jgi:hypothetical protein